MEYLSTRGGCEPVAFSDAVLQGMAPDGGLYLPRRIPRVSSTEIAGWNGSVYQYVALEVMRRFIDDIDLLDLEVLVEQAYASFRHPQVTPITRIGDMFVMELFHGPTLAFKDVALQFLGHLFSLLLQRRGGVLNILGATSGDTGSAAIHGVRGRENIRIFMLHPHGRTSPLQALQMITVTDDNVFNLAVDGTFDDCQAMVKAVFADLEFKQRHHLGAVNSINWARILAQVVYYVYAVLKLRKIGESVVDFSVPTGNFGDIFAGVIARRLLPEGWVGRLVLATNANDILHRFVSRGDYSTSRVTPTMSPSMDIQKASNFERYLYLLFDGDQQAVRSAMETFAATGALDLSGHLRRIREDFASEAVSEAETLETIGRYHRDHGYLLDPHTAVGVLAGERHRREGRAMVCLATAHPAKFGDAVRRATGQEVALPPQLAGLADLPRKVERLGVDVEALKAFVAAHALGTVAP